MKAYGDVKVRLHTLLNAALDGGEWSGFRPGDFYRRNYCTYKVGGWAGSSFGYLGDENDLAPAGNGNPGCSA